MTKITKAVGYMTEDGRMFRSLNEAAGHKYSAQLKTIVNSPTFGVHKILENSREIEAILRAYNEELDTLEVTEE